MAHNDGFGVIIQRSIASVWTTIAQIKDGPVGPSLDRTMIDVTSKDSTSRYREFLAGLRDGGEVTFTIGYDPAGTTHAQLLTDFGSDTAASWRVAFADSDTWAAVFSAFVKSFQPTGPLDDELTADVTLKITGVVTMTDI